MMKTLGLSVLTIFCGLVFAQDQDVSDQAPAPVDEALRARVEAFYQAHVDAKFRQADQFVEEDSKDAFFVAEKPHYKSFQISKIIYSENFTRATVVTACKNDIAFRGERMPVTMPITTHWKLDDGTWFWYFVPPRDAQTPFGAMKLAPGQSDSPTPGSVIPRDPLAAAREILSRETSKVTLDRASVTVDQTRSSKQEIHLKNELPGPISVSVAGSSFLGLSIKPAKSEVGPGEEIAVMIAFSFEDPKIACKECLVNPGVRPPVNATIRVEPSGQELPLKIIFTQPETNR
jgi:hypothetical protein